MTLTRILLALSCAITLPTAALAQAPVHDMSATAGCCAPDDGSAAAAAVLLPPVTATPADACCQTGSTGADVVDHSAHAAPPPATAPAPMTKAMEAMACGDVKKGCDMPCCAGMPPKH